jgi:hypothetical protein
MKEEWLFPYAIVPVDVETTAALVAEIHRLIGVVGGMALAQPEQEPVAWLESEPSTKNWPLRNLFANSWSNSYSSRWHVGSKKPDAPLGNRLTPLYLAPPQREWVGLTEEEYKNIRYGSDESGPYVSYGEYDEGYECGSEIEIYVDDFAKAIEAKLREKNTC